MAKKKEKSYTIKVDRRWATGILVFVGLILVYMVLALITFNPSREPKFGVTFSKPFAESLGVDWKANYIALLDELNIKYLRIPTYWNQVEPQENQYNFEDVDWMIDEASKRDAKVVLTLGMRQPRWPECHFPEWVEDVPPEVLSIKVKQLIFTTVQRYKNNPTVEVWQVENEPLLEIFGECPPSDRELVQEEIELVRALDDTRPIMVTVSGELSMWYPEALWGDVLGSTMYRTTWNEYLAKIPGYDGYWDYWFIPPSMFRVKAFIVGKDINDFWVAELQAEPWFPGDPKTTSVEDMYKSLSPEKLLENVEYALRSNPKRIYLWGAEWWYYMRESRDVDAIWETVERLPWGE